MNLPNKLTVSRLLLTILFMAVLFSDLPFHETAALVLFTVASITDYFDGRIARREKLITNFGILMDPLADKILICSAFIAFVGFRIIPAWMVVVVVSRELVITGLRLLAASKNVVLAAESCGKHKTISQVVAIVSLLVMVSYPQWGWLGQTVFGFGVLGHPWVTWVAEVAVWVAVVLTFTSGSIYLWRNRQLYIEDM